MKNVIRALGAVVLYFCVATIISQAVFLGVLYLKGGLNRERAWNVLASLYGIDTEARRRLEERKAEQKDADQESYEDRVAQRALVGLDLGMREMAIKNERQDLNFLRSQLRDSNQFKIFKEKIDTLLTENAAKVRDEGIEQTRTLLETLAPRQAREQLVLMLDDAEDADALDSVVAVVKSMSTDKRRKLLAEFKQPGDEDRLHRILERVGEGEPLASRVRGAHRSLKGFMAPQ